MMAGGGLFLLMVAHSGWSAASLYLAFLVLLFPCRSGSFRSRSGRKNSSIAPVSGIAIGRRETRYGLLLIVGLNLGVRVVLPFYAPLLLDHGLNLSELGWLFGSGSVIAGVLGTVIGGVFDSFNRTLASTTYRLWNSGGDVAVFCRLPLVCAGTMAAYRC
ncbi:hypothetical protein P4S72_18750 [Vibrio sp. PP-XX7]